MALDQKGSKSVEEAASWYKPFMTACDCLPGCKILRAVVTPARPAVEGDPAVSLPNEEIPLAEGGRVCRVSKRIHTW